MYDFRTLTLGYVPTRRDTFPDPMHAIEQRDPVRRRVEELVKACGDVKMVDIDCINEEKLLFQNDDIPKIVEKFRAAGVDALFIAMCNFGQEESIAKLAKELGKPVLLWGPRDPMPPKDVCLDRQTDTQCGIFAAGRALSYYNVPFTYIENCHLDSTILEKGFNDFIRTASVVKAMTNLRIGQISNRPWQFLSVKVNEAELLERFGIEIVTINEAQLLAKVREFLNDRTDETDSMVQDILRKVKFVDKDDYKVRAIAAFELAMLELAKIHGCRAFACECWDVLPKEIGIRPCFAFGDLTDRGLPVACETDIHGSISSVMLTAAARGETPNFIADVTLRHPENENAELLWHCGPFPSSIVKEGATAEVRDCHGQWEVKGGELTIARLGASHGKYSLFAGCACGTSGPVTNGNYVWIETNDWVAWEKKLVYGPYIHHVAAIHGNYVDILKESLKYLCDITFDPAP